MSSSSAINYARFEGIHHSELPAAIIFAVLYFPCIFLFLALAIRQRTSVWRALVLFSVVRTTAFILRAILAGSSTAGNNLNLYIAEQVLYSIGFFGLLYSTYVLVLDRDVMVNGSNDSWQAPGPLGIITRIMRNRMFIRIILMVAVALGIAGGVEASSSDTSKQATGDDLRKASLYIFLVMSCLLFLVTVTLVIDEHVAGYRHERTSSLGKRFGIFALFAISLLCIAREAFLCATESNQAKQNNAPLFYPLAALTEFIAAMLFLLPGLVPSKAELDSRKYGKSQEMTQADQWSGSDRPLRSGPHGQMA